ncbi:MAG TPA: hypothetical protein VL381_04195 [Rhodocyclaceae bacterium]|jgi:hypothetical protein|nr:hypothetical protein [Rhodocyclaceae bacterium]
MNTPFDIMQWSLAVFLSLLELSFICFIWLGAIGKLPKYRGICLQKVISEQDGSASFSRFQFLIFTFIIASSYVVITFKSGELPELTPGVLILMGMSGANYLISKNIEAKHPAPPAPPESTTDNCGQ